MNFLTLFSKLISPQLTRYFAILIWFLGIINILYWGQKPYTRRPSGITDSSSIELIIFSCGIFSIYFLWLSFKFLTKNNSRIKTSDYIVGIAVLGFEFFIFAFGAMHAPPIWFGLWLGILASIIFHFIWLPFICMLRLIFKKLELSFLKNNPPN